MARQESGPRSAIHQCLVDTPQRLTWRQASVGGRAKQAARQRSVESRSGPLAADIAIEDADRAVMLVEIVEVTRHHRRRIVPCSDVEAFGEQAPVRQQMALQGPGGG